MFLTLKDKKGNEVARNEYCLSPVDDIHNWKRYNWIRIRLSQHADYKALADLGQATLNAVASTEGETVKVKVTNTSDKVAFFVRMALKDAEGQMVTPAFWNENFISLKPGESRTYTCRTGVPAQGQLNVELSGWNIAPATLSL